MFDRQKSVVSSRDHQRRIVRHCDQNEPTKSHRFSSILLESLFLVDGEKMLLSASLIEDFHKNELSEGDQNRMRMHRLDIDVGCVGVVPIIQLLQVSSEGTVIQSRHEDHQGDHRFQ